MADTTAGTNIGNTIREFAGVYIRYLKNPMQEIRRLPDWSWKFLIINQLVVTAALGAISGLMQRNVLSIFQGLIVVPIITAFTIFVGALFFYFFFQVFGGVTLTFRRLMELLFFANIPFFIFQTVSHWFPPINLIALAFAALLTIVGLCDNFQLERKMVIRTVAGVYVLFLAVWAVQYLAISKSQSKLNTEFEAPEIELGK